MNTIAKFLIWVGLFIVTSIIANANPVSIIPIIYYLPLFVVTYYFMRPKEVVKQGVIADPKYLAVLKSVLAFLTAIVASGIDIPILNQLIEGITLILGNAEGVEQAVRLVIAFAVGLYGIFAKKDSALGYVANGFKKVPVMPREIHLD